ncbi:MAG TPA: hypothetical protein VK146_00335, partial [Tabrizicola sp.]|nr:hypothetical protein [Tabrizicola sp.]
MQPVLALAPFTAPVTEATSDTPPAVAGAFLASVEEEQVLPDPAAGPLVNWLPSVPVVAPFVVEATKMVADVGFPPDLVEREAASLAAVQGDLAVQPDAGIAAEPLVVALTKESSANPQAENRVQVPHRHAEASKKVSTPEPSEQALLSRSAVASAVMGVLVPKAEDAS